MQNQNTIVIVGGGFGGINAAVLLAKKNLRAKIILIDRRDYHLYYPNLYEVATSEEEFTSIADLKKSIVLPFKEILPGNVEFVRAELESIDHEKKFVRADGRQINYDYLILASGSINDYFNIPGLREHAFTLKSLEDALRIRNQAEFVVQQHRLDVNKKSIRFMVGGGGFSGCEFSAELLNLIEILSWKYSYPLEKIEVCIVEGSNQLLPGMPRDLSEKVFWRLKSFGVEIMLNSMITNVSSDKVMLADGETLNYDMLIWTGGVRCQTMPFAEKIETDKKERCVADKNLLSTSCEDVYVIGDNACIMDGNKIPLPQTAQQAIYQAEYVAGAIEKRIKGKPVPKFKPKQFGYIIPVRGKWAVLHFVGGSTLYGFTGWLAHRFADLRYFRKLMPFWKALRLAWFDTELYAKND